MRNFVLILVAALVLASCQSPMTETPVTGGKVETKLATATFAININGGSVTASKSVAGRSVIGAEDTVSFSFRSSDIGFWKTPTSAKFSNQPDAKYKLADTVNTVQFIPGSVNIANTGTNTNNVNLVAGTYDMVRVDMGGGQFSVKVNGSTVQISGGNSININCVVLLKELDTPVLVTRNMYVSAGTVGKFTTDSGSTLVDSFIADNQFFVSNSIEGANDGCNGLDIDGALFLPFDGIDVVDASAPLSIVFDWDINGAFIGNDVTNTYTMADRVAGTPFDFKVSVVQ